MDKEMTDKKYSESEMRQHVAEGIQEAKLGILIEDFKDHKNSEEKLMSELFASVNAIKDSVANFPQTLQACRDDMENDIRNNFVSNPEIELIETRFESKVNRLYWIGAGGWTAFTVLNFLIAKTTFFGA